MINKKILVVDDEPGVTRNLKLNLEFAGDYEVLGENHAANALAAARAFRPDLILLDVMMPGMDGADLAARFQADPLLRDTPVIFLTAIVSNRETDGRQMLRGGGIFLAKPVETAVLIRSIEQVLSHHSHPQNRTLTHQP